MGAQKIEAEQKRVRNLVRLEGSIGRTHALQTCSPEEEEEEGVEKGRRKDPA